MKKGYTLKELKVEKESSGQWRNDGVDAASRDGDGGPTGKGDPDSSKFLMINI